MEFLEHLGLGFGVAMTLHNLGYCLVGVLLGTLIGVLPGVGPLVTISMLLPLTFGLAPVSALIMLAGIYYGAQYGGSTAAILVNLPGETSSAVTCLDGYQMARQGRAGAALAAAALASFIAGCIGTLLIALLGVPLAGWAIEFGAEDYFSLMVMGLVSATVLSSGDTLKAIAMVVVGLLIGLVGTDVNSGMERYTFDVPELADGIGFTVLAVGLFAIAEVMKNLVEPESRTVFRTPLGGMWLRAAEFKAMLAPSLRGTALGAFFGVLPGTGPTISTFAAYMVEKKLARDPERLGQGAIEGVAAPEAANNAAAQTAFIPTLTLGIPGSATMALILGAMVMNGVQPGPTVMTRNPELFWGVIASMFIGNALLVALNLPLVGLWVRLLSVPYRWLFPAIVMFCALGNYTVNGSTMDVYLCAGVGVLGYVFARLDCPPAPLVLGYVLGPLMEENLRRALLLSAGDASVFFTRPISLGFLVVTGLLLLGVMLPRRRRAAPLAEAAP
ncbi:putative tricarboxylic transport membrane protein [Variovorax sp. TBS-050B]|uniref:tripartite tricarboxylate transporter permease n=1 Tax=Variovorax sp. TBS-050B TaxID=2940551 RepID=UPI0024734706|nr:tripartite tricarboxylate transporter permease [Variovorax sp. TBS-050B]MDH6592488.1 putative tricarboxylic transport membrane protein [Variovorax sp. TBS-050B]